MNESLRRDIARWERGELTTRDLLARHPRDEVARALAAYVRTLTDPDSEEMTPGLTWAHGGRRRSSPRAVRPPLTVALVAVLIAATALTATVEPVRSTAADAWKAVTSFLTPGQTDPGDGRGARAATPADEGALRPVGPSPEPSGRVGPGGDSAPRGAPAGNADRRSNGPDDDKASEGSRVRRERKRGEDRRAGPDRDRERRKPTDKTHDAHGRRGGERSSAGLSRLQRRRDHPGAAAEHPLERETGKVGRTKKTGRS
jgi:type IV secretory pathway VirB10-like protein